MAELRITFNRKHPDYERIVGGIRSNLAELDSITVKEVTEVQEPGTLTAEWSQITEFVLQHAEQLADVARAVIEMTTAVILLRSSRKHAKDTDKPVVITSGETALALPASTEKNKVFIASIEGSRQTPKAGHSPVAKRRGSATKARRRSGRKRR